ncbi:MAG: Do family serine endopeptidase [bacterium]|nr:Do family serine endopeptidase [bacterium]
MQSSEALAPGASQEPSSILESIAEEPAIVEYVPESREQLKVTFAPVVRKAAPAVVNIYATKVIRPRFTSPLLSDPLFRHFFGGFESEFEAPSRVQRSLGSGVLVRADGVIVTNYHVIDGANEIKVVLLDGREFKAKIIAKEKRTDLAVLKISGDTFPFLTLKDADALEVGDPVLAIGNPFGLGQTVTSGIVSALARNQLGVRDFRSLIQTDAAINPGNSGGALVSLDGFLVGINTAILSRSGGSMGLGFAVPSNLLVPLIASADNEGKILRPWTGVAVQSVNAEMAKSLGLPRPYGVLITGIYKKSPAEKAGLKVGDFISHFQDKEITDEFAFHFRVASATLNKKIFLRVRRQGTSDPEDVALTPIVPPESSHKPLVLTGRHPLSGAKIVELSPALTTELGLNFMEGGIIVLGVRPGAIAERVGLLGGDIVHSVNGQKVTTVRSLSRALSRGRQGWKIELRRGGEVFTVQFR